jgi:predicted phosphodiesterase
LVSQVAEVTVVHASLASPELWGYVFDKCAAAESFAHQRTSLCFFGHTHVSCAFEKGRKITGGTFTKLKISPRKQYLINPGSVGQPRDLQMASYAIYDVKGQSVELRRLEYDRQATRSKLRQAGLA